MEESIEDVIFNTLYGRPLSMVEQETLTLLANKLEKKVDEKILFGQIQAVEVVETTIKQIEALGLVQNIAIPDIIALVNGVKSVIEQELISANTV